MHRPNVRIRVLGITLDRRTEDLHRRHDEIERKRFAWRVARNPKELRRLTNDSLPGQ